MILNINKPKDYTSADIVRILKKELNVKKIGHTGTLDPLATGVLIVVTDSDTKLVELLTSTYKEYIATIKLGIQTDTFDITGKITEEKDFNVNENQIKEILNSFLGKSIQTVPIYSAVKVNGKKLYEYARNNIEVKLPQKEIEILNIQLLEFNNDIIKFKTTVSKGTYIRSLINDICKKLDTTGTMQDLIRTKQGYFSIDNSYNIDNLKNIKPISLKDVLKKIPFEKISNEKLKNVQNGALILKEFDSEKIVYTDNNDNVIAIYQEYTKDKKMAKPYIMFNSK